MTFDDAPKQLQDLITSTLFGVATAPESTPIRLSRIPGPRINVELLLTALSYIQANPKEWNQDYYTPIPDLQPKGKCGTACCIAGWAVAFASQATPGSRSHPLSRSVSPLIYAQTLLGLTWREAASLFDPYNSLRNLEEKVTDIIAGETRR